MSRPRRLMAWVPGAGLRSARARDQLGPLGEALTARGGSANLDLAQLAAAVRQRA